MAAVRAAEAKTATGGDGDSQGGPAPSRPAPAGPLAALAAAQPAPAAGPSSAAPLVAVVEAVLFAAAEPVSAGRLAAACGVGEAEVRRALAALGEALADPRRGVELRQVAGGYRLYTKAVHAGIVEHFLAGGRTRLSPGALETLAVVAYRQPVTRAEIEDVRGVHCDHALRTLLDRRLIRVLGRRDAPGRPLLYGTTDAFLEYLGLRDLSELPPVPGLTGDA